MASDPKVRSQRNSSASVQGGIKDPEKPFRTIEVLDSRTNQRCKIACMSCIRGHRTTSCGIPVCRPKVFWTVKRPGRPSNSCTCRYGTSGSCVCVVARTACPHKSKKGEKRSGECRCDEQGRLCCILDHEQWNKLAALEHPTVEFFSSREELDKYQQTKKSTKPARTRSFSIVSDRTPSLASATPSVDLLSPQVMPGHVSPTQTLPSYQVPQQRRSTQPMRFGMMGVGAPQGSFDNPTIDYLAWDKETSPLFRDWRSDDFQSPEQNSCCQDATPTSPRGGQSQPFYFSNPLEQSTQHSQNAADGLFGDLTALAPIGTVHTSHLEINQRSEYFQYPFAICQSCGLAGCNCRTCPPVFQNPNTGSWAQGCGRKHARDVYQSHTPEPSSKAPRLHLEPSSTTENTRIVFTRTSSQFAPYSRGSVTATNGPISPSDSVTMHLPMDGFSPTLDQDLTNYDMHNLSAVSPSSSSLLLNDLVDVDFERTNQQNEMEDSRGSCCRG